MKLKEDLKGVHVICMERQGVRGKTTSVSFVVFGTTKGRLLKFLKNAVKQKSMKKVAEAARKKAR